MKKITRNSSHSVSSVKITRNLQSDQYASFLFDLRAEIIKCLEEKSTKRASIARKLGISRSVVTRVLDPTSDILASTLFDFAWALERKWSVRLIPMELPLELQYFDELDTIVELKNMEMSPSDNSVGWTMKLEDDVVDDELVEMSSVEEV